jgi:hypothetical protein
VWGSSLPDSSTIKNGLTSSRCWPLLAARADVRTITCNNDTPPIEDFIVGSSGEKCFQLGHYWHARVTALLSLFLCLWSLWCLTTDLWSLATATLYPDEPPFQLSFT